MVFTMLDIYKMLLAVLCGGLIGAEREYRDKSAGFRTLIFICVGATLFTLISLKFGSPDDDQTRIAANIVSGVGFLGAGAIMRSSQRVIGLTTASTIWITAALGMAIGAGSILFSCIVTFVVLVILWIFPHFEVLIDRYKDARPYEIQCRVSPEIHATLENQLKTCELKLHETSCNKSGETLIFTWFLSGQPHNHDRFMDFLIENEEIVSFQC
ncbi:MAG: MgtC/SapB family protein [Anaerolineales bacterium]|nr:MgtC/SapB family protein [Anaerolineales bacterium]